MARKKKAIVNTPMRKLIEALLPQKQTLNYGDGEDAFSVTVSPVISFETRNAMVREIADTVFIETTSEDGTKQPLTIDSYSPEYLKLTKRYAAIKYFTDLQLPVNLDELWLVVNHTPIYDDVAKVVGDDLLDIFQEAVAIIESRKRYLEGKTDIKKLFERIFTIVDGLGHEFSDVDITKVMDVIGKMSTTSQEDILKEVVKAQHNDPVDDGATIISKE